MGAADVAKTAAMIVTQVEDGTFSVLDANGSVHEASSEAELGALCTRIVNDPSLPTYDTQSAAVDDLQQMVTKVAEAVLPDRYGFIAAPAVGMVKKAVTKLQTFTSTEPVRPIRNTPDTLREGNERARKRREEKDRLKAEARKAVELREKQRPRLSSVRT